MVVSASRRTDIPAYYMDWLMGRLEAGHCLVRNPFDARRTRRVSLLPPDLDLLVLWTRDPRSLLPRVREIEDRGIRFYVHLTLTNYPPALEPGAPPLAESLASFQKLAQAIGSGRVLWRYDPILQAEGLGPGFHLENFALLASALEGATARVYLSLLDEYAGTATRLGRAGFRSPLFGSPKGGASAPGLPEPYAQLLGELAAIARLKNILPLACAEPYDLSALGIEPGSCVDAELAARLWGLELPPAKDSGQRKACRCAASVDIGAYGTCPRGCLYCYANRGAGRLSPSGADDEAL